MEKRILNYRKYIDELLQKDNLDWDEVIREHLIQVSFFQHERLIHLIVTVTFAILEVIVIGLCVTAFSPGLGLLALALLVLLIPYIRHYYILENEVQKMYAQYDRMVLKRAAKDSAAGADTSFEKFCG
ncbi:MAG: hypothetical protein ACI4SN_01505 [Lachnospiraceae bacterium]